MPASYGVQRAAPERRPPAPFLSNGCCGSGARLSEDPIERTLQRWCVGAFIEALEPALASREPGV